MATIDLGEKHLFKRRLLYDDDSVIAYSDITDVTFELLLQQERVVNTWSKLEGDVSPNGDFIDFELDSAGYRTGDYYIRATIVMTEPKWQNNVSQDISWGDDKITITDAVNAYNHSSSTDDIKFDISP